MIFNISHCLSPWLQMMWLMRVVPVSVVVDLDLVTEVTDRVDHTAHLVIDLTELLGLYTL